MADIDEDKVVCMYDDKVMTVTQYRKKRGVAEFEKGLRALAMQSVNCLSDRTDIRTDKLYPIFNTGFPSHPNRRCKYFETHVLPNDPKLETDYWNIYQGGKVSGGVMTAECKRCGIGFTKTAKNQLYCTDCRDYIEKERKRAYYHKRKEQGD